MRKRDPRLPTPVSEFQTRCAREGNEVVTQGEGGGGEEVDGVAEVVVSSLKHHAGFLAPFPNGSCPFHDRVTSLTCRPI